MQHDAEDVTVTHAMLREMPMADRLAALVCASVEENPGAGRSVAAIPGSWRAACRLLSA